MSNLEELHLLDFPKICRICLSKENVLPVKNSFIKMFKDVIGIEFFYEENLPRNVCINCNLKLEEIFYFINIYKKNDAKLKNIFKNEINKDPVANEPNFENHSNSHEINLKLVTQIDIKEQNAKKDLNLNNCSANQIYEVIDLSQENDADNIEILCNTCNRTFLNMEDLLNHERFNPKCSQGNKINNAFNLNKRGLIRPSSRPKKMKKKLKQVVNNINSSKTDSDIHTRTFLSDKEIFEHQMFNPPCRQELVNEEVENVQKNVQMNQLIIEDTVQNSVCSTLPLTEFVNEMKNSHQCLECGKFFKNRWCYERHIKSHTGERPHTCNICKKGFRQKAHLKDHLRIHSGEKPYQCFICKRSFRHLSTISKHQHRHIEVL